MGWEAVASDRKFKLANVLKEKNLNSSFKKMIRKSIFPYKVPTGFLEDTRRVILFYLLGHHSVLHVLLLRGTL